MATTIVIVGASLAGASAAATLRHEGFDGKVLLVGAEARPPYERPPLSKQYLRGEMPAAKTMVRPERFYEENRIETLFGVRATAINSRHQIVLLDTGRHLRYDELLIATGAKTRRPPIPGIELPGVFDLRTIDDADALRDAIAPGRRAVIVGLGFIGCEVTASLRAMGVDVVAVDPSPTPLFRALGATVGRTIAALHEAHGVDAVYEDRVTQFEGIDRVTRVATTRGRRLDCDFVVLGIGVAPDLEFVDGTDIATNNGIVVDEYCQSTVPHVWAAGDVANHYHPLYRRHVRVEHWQNAMHQGAAAARNMLGKRQPYAPVHWFWSDQYDVNLQYAGSHDDSHEFVVRGDLAGRDFIGFYLDREGRIHAAVAMNRGKEVRRAMPLLNGGTIVNRAILADEGVDLRSLVQAAPAR
jgi:3-phenylpropionate/trans-cinnamate dioxygenase ferredoxin reductase subunit